MIRKGLGIFRVCDPKSTAAIRKKDYVRSGRLSDSGRDEPTRFSPPGRN